MFFTEARLKTKKYRSKVIVFVVICCMTLLMGCSQGMIEAPNRGFNIWGFGNKPEVRSNTFTVSSPAIADSSLYAYYDEPAFTQIVKAELRKPYKGIYKSAYQDEVRHQLKKLIKYNEFSVDYPLFIHNPFGTNASGLYVYMGTSKEQLHLYYTIAAENEAIPDFADTMYINKAMSDSVEGQLVGLIPGQYNKVVIELRDASGNGISKNAYLLYVPKSESTVTEQVAVIQENDNNGSRGLFHLLSINEEGQGQYLFYDNYGVLRSQIPTKVSNINAKVLQVGNQIFYESSNNIFVLVDNLGGILEFYIYKDDFQLMDYDYDEVNHKILFLAKDRKKKDISHIVQLKLETKEWETIIVFSKLIKGTKKLLLSDIQVVNGNDLIVCSKALSSVFRINNIDTIPVIRWIIGEEQRWQKTAYDSLLLYETGEVTKKSSFDSVKFVVSKELEKGQFYISLIDYNTVKSKGEKVAPQEAQFRNYLIDQKKNRYRMIQRIKIGTQTKHCSSLMYGSHIIVSLGDKQEIVEYNEKGEIVLRMRYPNPNSSYQIYKNTMDRYWF